MLFLASVRVCSISSGKGRKGIKQQQDFSQSATIERNPAALLCFQFFVPAILLCTDFLSLEQHVCKGKQ